VKLATAVDEVLSGEIIDGRIPELWDGQAAARILRILRSNHTLQHAAPNRSDLTRQHEISNRVGAS
jgi:hypothetical protein